MKKISKINIVVIVAILAAVTFASNSCQLRPRGQAAVTSDTINWHDSCYALYKIASDLNNLNLTDSLERFVPMAKAVCAEHNQRMRYYAIWERLADAYIWEDQFDKAVAEAQKIQEEAKSKHESYGLFVSYKILGTGYMYIENFDEAEVFFRKAISSFTPDNPPGQQLACFRYLCQIQRYSERFEAADSTLTEWRKVLDRFPVVEGEKDADVYACFQVNYRMQLSYFLMDTGRYQEAELQLDSAAYYEVIDGNYDLNLMAIEKSRCELARKREDLNSALQHSQKMLDLAISSGSNSYQKTALMEQTLILEGLGRYEEALHYFHQYDELKDSLALEDSRDQLNKLNKQYAVNELESQNEQLQERSRFATGSLVMIMGIVALLVFLVFSSRWSRQLEVKNHQLQRERNVVVAQNKQLAEERDRAEAASRAKTAFIQSMSHEIRTPLNHISGFSQVLAMPDADLPEEERLSLSQHIQEGTRHLTNIIDDLILISDMESRSDLPPAEDYYPSIIASQAVEAVRPELAADVTVNNNCLLPDELTVSTHPALLHTALVKLLDNAAKFTSEGSITLVTEYNDGALHFSVKDTGPGIPADKAEFIFERFAKLDSLSQGTGLGLPVARMITERLGGTLTLDTSYTEGAKFDLIIKV